MMEQRYRHMMEQVNMDEDFEAGLLERIQEGRPKRRPRPLRTALIAACVCVAVVGTAVAAEVVGGIPISNFFTGLTHDEAIQQAIPDYQGNDTDETTRSGYVVGRSGVGASLENISDEAVALLEESPDRYVKLTFASWDEAEDFLGLEIHNNEVLSQMNTEFHYTITPCSVRYGYGYGGDDGVSFIQLSALYSQDVDVGDDWPREVTISVGADLFEHGEEQINYVSTFPDGTIFTEETYVSPAGVEMNIVHAAPPDTQGNVSVVYHFAYFYVGGVQYSIYAMAPAPVDPEVAWSMLQEVLDAFEFGDLT